jgi:hypothetical protein
VRRVAQLVGLLVGFALGIVLVEVVFSNNKSWPDVVPFVFAVLGWLAASALFSRRERTPTQ